MSTRRRYPLLQVCVSIYLLCAILILNLTFCLLQRRPRSTATPSTVPATNTTEPGPRLPQELFDMVIDHMYSDTATLRQCSLVCRGWVATSSLHLFRRVKWPPCCYVYPNVTVVEELLPSAELRSMLSSLPHLQVHYLSHGRVMQTDSEPVPMAHKLPFVKSLCLDIESDLDMAGLLYVFPAF